MFSFQYKYSVALKSILYKECNRYLRIWVQTLVPPAITMTLYFVVFGSLIGNRVGEVNGFEYVEFMMPGLIMLAIINNAYSNVASSFFSAKFQRNIEELLVAPVPTFVIVAGYVLGGVSRALLVGTLVTVVALFFVDINVFNWWVLLSTLLLTAILFSLAGFINAIFASTFDDISIIPTFILSPLTYLGGVFFSISMLPDFWQGVSQANPIIYMVNAFRYGFLGFSDVNLVLAYGVLISLTVILFFTAIRLINKGVGIRS